MTENVYRRDVSGQNEQSLLSLPQSLDNLLDSSSELTSLGSLFGRSKDLFVQFLGGERRSDRG